MKWLVLLHVLGASIWVGGHLILTLGFLPQAVKAGDPKSILDFEKRYERIGIPALVVQVITGFWMASIFVPVSEWFSLATMHHAYLWIKIILLISTLVLAVHARFFIIPKLTAGNLISLAYHIRLTSLVAVLFVVTGLSFRFSYW